MRTTIILNDALYRAVKVKAAQSDETVSSIIQDALVFQLLEDQEDIEAAEKRADEAELPFDELVTEFKSEGLL